MRQRSLLPLITTAGCALLVGTACFPLAAPVLYAQNQQVETTTTTTTGNEAYGLFYQKLNTGGSWLEVEHYGYVWQPEVAVSQRDWRPYSDGYWAQTGAGWTWVSNEDFGWATYHYGRWVRLAERGWVWVPGDEWAPAWVSWRVSGDKKHIGWAPLTPEVRVRKGTEVKGWVDSTYDIGPDYYNFISTSDFGADSYRTHLLPPDRTTTIITETTNVTSIRYTNVGGRELLYNGGPEVTVIKEFSGRPVRELRLETRDEQGDAFVRTDSRSITRVNGGVLTVLTAPAAVITARSFAARPVNVRERVTEVRVDRGYGQIRDPQEIERVRAHYRSTGPAAPPEIQNQAAASLRQTRSMTPAGQTAPGAPAPGAPAPGAVTPGAPAPGAPRGTPPLPPGTGATPPVAPSTTAAPGGTPRSEAPAVPPTPGATAPDKASPSTPPATQPGRDPRTGRNIATPTPAPGAQAAPTPVNKDKDKAPQPAPRKGGDEAKPGAAASPAEKPAPSASPKRDTRTPGKDESPANKAATEGSPAGKPPSEPKQGKADGGEKPAAHNERKSSPDSENKPASRKEEKKADKPAEQPSAPSKAEPRAERRPDAAPAQPRPEAQPKREQPGGEAKAPAGGGAADAGAAKKPERAPRPAPGGGEEKAGGAGGAEKKPAAPGATPGA